MSDVDTGIHQTSVKIMKNDITYLLVHSGPVLLVQACTGIVWSRSLEGWHLLQS
jgi:hypothetical protein